MGTIPDWYQNQNYLSICTTKHKKFGPGGKTRVSAAGSSFKPLNGVFEHLDKILSCSTGLSDEKSFYCGSLWYMLVLIHKKKNFRVWIFFHVKNDRNLLKIHFPKKQCSPTFPQFLMKSPKNMDDNGPDSKKTSEPVFDLGLKTQV